MRRPVLAALAAALAIVPAAPARAAISLGGAPDGLQALTVAGGQAYAVVGSRDRGAPFALVRSGGRSVSRVGTFGAPGAEFPDAASTADDRVVVSWARRVTGGDAYLAASAGSLGDAVALGSGTGPGRLALGADGAPLLAFPDRVGDAVLASQALPVQALSASAPDRRHLPLDAAVDGAGRAYVLDLVQTAGSTELWLLGPDAPARAIYRAGVLRDVGATVALDGGLAYVAFGVGGRAHLARAPVAPDGAWRTRRLPGRGGGTGAPAVVRTAGTTLVAYTQRLAHGRGELFLARQGTGALDVRRLTRTRADERFPHAAAGPGGDVFVGWSRGAARRGPATAALARVR